LKPSNILVTSEGRPKIVDFGLARVVVDSDVSRSGVGFGTLAYMSPEQRRDAKRADHRSDIYALGKLVYAVLTGEVPDPVDPERIPAGVRGAVMRALKPEPADRWFSVEEFWGALEGGAGGRGGDEDRDDSSGVGVGVCAECGGENPEDVRYCRWCGAGLFEACPACGREDRRGVEYCGGCGVKIAEEKAYRDHLESARQHLEAGRYARAVKEARLASEVREGDSDAWKLLQEAEEKAARLQELRGRVREAVSGGRFDEAEEAVRSALELSPEDEELLGILKDLPRLRVAWEVGELGRQLEALVEARRWREALGVCERIREAAGGVEWEEGSDVLGVVSRAEGLDGEIRERLSRHTAGLAEARDLGSEHRYEEALRVLDRLEEEFPGEEATQELREELENGRRLIEGGVKAAREALGRGEYAKARQLALVVLRVWPDEPRAQGVLRKAQEELRILRARQRRELLVASGIVLGSIAAGLLVATVLGHQLHYQRAEQLFLQGYLEAALEQLDRAKGLGLSNGRVERLRTKIGRRMLERAEKAMTDGRFDDSERWLRLTFRTAPGLSQEVQSLRNRLVEAEARLAARERTRQAGQSRTFEIYPSVLMEFVWIPGGTFLMGSPQNEEGRYSDEGPVHKVEITRGFWLGRYEVTQAQWAGVTGGNPSYFKGPDRPVERVSWSDVQKFIRKLNELAGAELYRLPTEAEWEYACRAGTRTRFSWGDTDKGLDEYGWSLRDSGGETHAVGKKRPNPWGLYDMHGNVWEWCQDWYDPDYYSKSPCPDPTGPASGEVRVVRGGGCYSSPRDCRSANRDYFGPANRGTIGFRLLRVSR
jgi:formylglycine-generating enzyme required for sulfatase activity